MVAVPMINDRPSSRSLALLDRYLRTCVLPLSSILIYEASDAGKSRLVAVAHLVKRCPLSGLTDV